MIFVVVGSIECNNKNDNNINNNKDYSFHQLYHIKDDVNDEPRFLVQNIRNIDIEIHR